MTFPVDVVRRDVTFGVPFGLADGGDLNMVVTFTPNRSMVWGPLGFPAIARQYRVTSTSGMQGTVSLPVTDQAGWQDGNGNLLSVANGAQTHVYTVTIRFEDLDGKYVADAPSKNIALPTGDLSSVDLDTLLPVSTAGGVTIAIPDAWTKTYVTYDGVNLRQNGVVIPISGSGDGSNSGIALDTDGTPYFTPDAGSQIQLDTDGVPYLAA